MGTLQEIWNNVCTFVLANIGRIVAVALVLIFGLLVVKILLSILRRAMNKSRLKGAAGDFLISLSKVVLLAIYFIALLALLGVPTTSLIALFSACALAVSLALQGTFSNVAAGLVIVATKPFEEGDFVDIGGTSGTVVTITIFNTKLKTGDNKMIVLPNGTVSGANITNYSTFPTRRLDLTFSAAYGTDVEKVKSVILGVIAGHDEILKTPTPLVRLAEHGDSSMDFVTRVWVKQEDYWNVNFDLKEEMLAAFEENGIDVPYQQIDVHVVQ